MKKKNNDAKIIAAMDALDKGVRTLEKFGARYDEYIDKAALQGNDARAKQLIRQKHRVYSLADQLRTLKGNIELGAFSAHAISQLAGLPEALSACKGLLAESPDFGKLEKTLKSIFTDMNKTEAEIAKLNEILEPQPSETIASRLDGSSPYEDETSDWFTAEYEAMIERLKKYGGNSIPAPAETAPVENATGEIDYIGIVEEEKKKK